MSEKVARIKELHAREIRKQFTNLKAYQHALHEHYSSLHRQEGEMLAQYTIYLLDQGDEDQAEDILWLLSCYVAESLKPIHRDLLARRRFYPSIAYYKAESSIAVELLKLLEQNAKHPLFRNHILLALSWIGDQVVQDAMQKWRDQPPQWASTLYVSPAEYAKEAGWELTAAGTRRDLFLLPCFPLLRKEGPAAELNELVKVVSPHEVNCKWCKQPLTTLFDFELATVRDVLSVQGKRLRIATCEACCCYGRIYTHVDWDGKTVWSDYNARPDYLPDDLSDWMRLPEELLVCAEHSRSPLISASWYSPIAFSQIGGYPTWIQDAEYPNCPHCQQTMLFIAQLSNEDLDDFSEGIYYAFLCVICKIAATNYQQS